MSQRLGVSPRLAPVRARGLRTTARGCIADLLSPTHMTSLAASRYGAPSKEGTGSAMPPERISASCAL